MGLEIVWVMKLREKEKERERERERERCSQIKENKGFRLGK